ELQERLPNWIEAAPYLQLADWEDFCRHHTDGDVRAAALVKIAQRYSGTDGAHGVELLVEAWLAGSDFFYEHSGLAKQLLGLLLNLDQQRGRELLFESFRKQYSRYPESIVFRLDSLLEFAEHFPPFDRVRL